MNNICTCSDTSRQSPSMQKSNDGLLMVGGLNDEQKAKFISAQYFGRQGNQVINYHMFLHSQCIIFFVHFIQKLIPVIPDKYTNTQIS